MLGASAQLSPSPESEPQVILIGTLILAYQIFLDLALCVFEAEAPLIKT